ncbi:MAG: hypothetical protein ACE5IA_07070, partial [Dehalococcoidia bacterium]
RYIPDRDVTVWMQYYLQAHVDQAHASLEFIRRAVNELDALSEAFRQEDITTWQVLAIWVACSQGQISNRDLQSLSGRAPQTVVLDFTKLLGKNLLDRIGRGRNTAYVPTQRVKEIFERVQSEYEANKVEAATSGT